MSLNRRIILSATLVLAVFISLTAITLERAFVDSTETALRDTLTSRLYVLMAVAEVDNGRLSMPSAELDALLGLPSSGIYAHITDQHGNILWQSSSTLGVTTPVPVVMDSGEKRFRKISVDESDYYSFSYGVDWTTDSGSMALTFDITTDLKTFEKQIIQYRNTLWGWLIAMAALLLVSQALILRWGLSPLRKVSAELNLIESGQQDKIKEDYPKEIERLTNNINILLDQERAQKTRYRNALGDLAHSLKTPLAVLQSGLQGKAASNYESLHDQITRMNSIVEYQLQRAATAGATSIGKSVNVNAICDRLLASLHKVYRDRQIQASCIVDAELIFRGDEGDLMEVIGNLMDNAFKWAEHSVEIRAGFIDNKLHISVSDDGPGIEQHRIDELVQRGKRADQTIAGHGIGLSIVQNIVQAYHGELKITESPTGGSRVTVIL